MVVDDVGGLTDALIAGAEYDNIEDAKLLVAHMRVCVVCRRLPCHYAAIMMPADNASHTNKHNVPSSCSQTSCVLIACCHAHQLGNDCWWLCCLTLPLWCLAV
jgi:hypothetical protein